MRNKRVEILIIGGGIAGCIAAIALSKDYQVTLIDKDDEPKQRIGESLAPAAKRILKQLNLYRGIPAAFFHKNIGMQSYWGSDECHVVDHMINPDGHVLNLNRQSFEQYLRDMAKHNGIECLWGTRFVDVKATDNGWQVTTECKAEHKCITAAFVIDASGRQSHFIRKLGVKRHHIDKLVACWATVPNDQKNTMSTLLSCQQGWWYSAVTPGNTRVVAFHTDSDLIDRNLMDDQQVFIATASENKVIGDLLSQNAHALQLQGMAAAASTCSQQVAGDRWVAVGDAAVSFDPLSSQGMLNAMATALQAVALINQHSVVAKNDATLINQFKQDYTQQINQIWLRYLQHKDLYYQQEQRWKNALFWQRRQA